MPRHAVVRHWPHDHAGAQQLLVHAPGLAHFDTHEIADRWNVIQAELLETFCQLSHAIGVHAPRLVQMRVIAERGQCRRLGDAVDVVRLAATVEDVGNRRTGYDTTDPADGHDGQ